MKERTGTVRHNVTMLEFAFNLNAMNWNFPSAPHRQARNFRKADGTPLGDVVLQIKEDNFVKKEKKKFLYCIHCKHPITSLDQRIEIDGSHTHIFKNPVGIDYRIGCFATALGCFNFGDPTSEFTWFPGFTWVYSNCLKCVAHLGWFYQSTDNHFHGLILNHLTQKK